MATPLSLDQIKERLGFDGWFASQREALDYWQEGEKMRLCVFHPTGTGKTNIMLACMALRDIEKEVVVVAPPATHSKWKEQAALLGMKIKPVSHMTFRDTLKIERDTPVIIDEFHLLGGQTGKGWKRLDRMAAGLQAPLVFASATPNYNDAERCYCIVHVLNPLDHRGGYESWLYKHCLTEPNRFARLPIITGLRDYLSAEEFLADQPGVVYVEDESPDILVDVPVGTHLSPEFMDYNLDLKRERIMASSMEKKHQYRLQQIEHPNSEDGTSPRLRWHVLKEIINIYEDRQDSILIYVDHSSLAFGLAAELEQELGITVGMITGKSPAKTRQWQLDRFLTGKDKILVGTASIATGTDGLDKICSTMIIVDDTEDASKRRQLVGRILPRGIAAPGRLAPVAYRFTYYEL